MAAFKRASLWVLIGVVFLGILLTAVSLYAPKILNNPVVKKNIQDGFLAYFNAQIDYQQVDISFLPYPHLVIHQGALSLGQETTSKFAAAAIYPKILSLLLGKFEFSKVNVDASETKIILAEKNAPPIKAPVEAIIDAWKQFSPVMAYLAKSENDDIAFQTRNARVDVYKKDRLLISLWDLDGKLNVPGEKLYYSFSCRSNLWERLSNKGSIDRKKIIAEGSIKVDGLQLQRLQQRYFPKADLRLGDSVIDMNLHYETDGSSMFKTSIESSSSSLPLMRGNNTVVLEGKRIEAGLSIVGPKIEVSVSSLDLISPKINLAGSFILDLGAPEARLEISGKDADVASVREVFLFIIEENPDVKDTFQIIRAGRVPRFTILSQAPLIDDLDALQNVRVQGNMVDGNILVPGIDFNLTKVHGEVVIAKGVLEGSRLSARFGNTSGSEGRLTLDLGNPAGPFHLDIMLDADASQLPPVLSRLIEDEPFRQELKRIQNVKGRAQGRLVLGDTLTSIHPRIDVSIFNVSAHYNRVPFPFSVRGGKLTLKDTRLAVSELTAASKGGSLSIIDAEVDWGKSTAFHATVGPSKIVTDEVYPWLRSMKVLRKRLSPVPSMKGKIRFSSAEFKGNYLRPESITFDMKGRVEGLAADIRPSGDKVYLDQGDFSLTRNILLFSKMKVTLPDASLSASGRIEGYVERMSVDLAGEIGVLAFKRASHLFRMPPEITLRTQLRISSGHLTMEKGKETSFSGQLAVQKGPRVDIDMSDSGEGLVIHHLRVKDDVSDGTLKLLMKNGVCDLSFKGRLERSTLDTLLTDNKVLTGWVEGDLEAWIRLDNFLKSTGIGKLKGEGFMVPLSNTSLRVNYLSIEAIRNQLRIDAARILWIDEAIDLSGYLTVVGESVRIDLDASMNRFDWDKYGHLITARKLRESNTTNPPIENFPLEGTIRFKSSRFRYGKYTWQPFIADFSFKPDRFLIDVKATNLCGISMPGLVTIHPESLELTIGTEAKDEFLGDALTCLGKQAYVIDGLFDLNGYAAGTGVEKTKILPKVKGEWKFSARDGHINRFTVLARIFELLNVAEIFKLKLPDLRTEGFSYKQIDITWRLNGGKIFIDAGHLDSSAMEIAFKGELDLIGEKVDILVLVAPLQTLNLIVKNIPVVRDILAGRFISIPFRVKGDLKDPDVSAMNPKDIGSEMLNLMKRTAHVPIQMIQPLTNAAKKKEEQPVQ